ncbi:hypothetical protein BST61_g10381 [Cercospora zeina]
MAPRKRLPFSWSPESSATSSPSSTSTSSTNNAAAAAQRVFKRRQAFIKTLGEIMKYFVTEMGDDFDVQEWELYKAVEKYIGRSFMSAAEAGSETDSEVYTAMAKYFKIRYKLLVGEVERHPIRLSAGDHVSLNLWAQKTDGEQKLLEVLAEKGDHADLDAAHCLFEQTDSALDGIFEQIQKVEEDGAATGSSDHKDRRRSSHDRRRRRRSAREDSRLRDNSPSSPPDFSPLGPSAGNPKDSAQYHPRHGHTPLATPSHLSGHRNGIWFQTDSQKARKSSATSKRTTRPSTYVSKSAYAGPSTRSPILPSHPLQSAEADGGVALTDESDLAYDSGDESLYTRLARATRMRGSRPEASNKQPRKSKGKQPARQTNTGREEIPKHRKSNDDEEPGLYRAMGHQFSRHLAQAQARQDQDESSSGGDV